MAISSPRFTAQRFGVALSALLVASMSVHDHRVATILQGGLSATGGTTAGSQPAHLVKAAYGTIGSNIAHHYPG